MNTYRVEIIPRGAFFLGMQSHARKSGALVHSDTLHAALMDVAALAGSPFLEQARQLCVSSVFPCWNDLYFYPKPFPAPPGIHTEAKPEERKRWKSVRLVSEGLLRAWLAQDVAQVSTLELLGNGLAALKSEVNGRQTPLRGFMSNALSPAVTIDRPTSAATPFDRRGLRLNTGEGVGAYFLVQLAPAMVESFRDLVERLGTQGLGGERSVGYGNFDVKGITECSGGLFNGSARANAFMTLSLYLPTALEVQSGILREPAAYDCTIRGGWMHDLAGSDRPKKFLRMCLEGSVFPAQGGPAWGEVRDIRPEGFDAHPVWRSGLALALPFATPGTRGKEHS